MRVKICKIVSRISQPLLSRLAVPIKYTFASLAVVFTSQQEFNFIYLALISWFLLVRFFMYLWDEKWWWRRDPSSPWRGGDQRSAGRPGRLPSLVPNKESKWLIHGSIICIVCTGAFLYVSYSFLMFLLISFYLSLLRWPLFRGI